MEERPPWNSSVSDVDKFKLGEDERIRQRLLHTSRNDASARKRLEADCGIPFDQQDEAFHQLLGPQYLAGRNVENDDDFGQPRSSESEDEDVRQFVEASAREAKKNQEEERESLVEIFQGLLTQLQAYEEALGIPHAEMPNVDHDNIATCAVETVARCCVHLSNCEIRIRNTAAQQEQQTLALASKSLEVEDLSRRLQIMRDHQHRQLSHQHTQTTGLSYVKEAANPPECSIGDDKARISRRHQLLMKWKQNSVAKPAASGSIGHRVQPPIIE